MKIVMMNGGLGNQVFQYIFFRWLEIRTGERCVIDDSAFFGAHVEHQGYELERVFSLYPRRLSSYFDQDVWNLMIKMMNQGIPIHQQLADAGMNLVMACGNDCGDYSGQKETFTMGMEPLDCSNTYYYGYWINRYWLQKITGIVATELRFPPLPDAANRRIGEQIRASSNPLAIHIRRGDMARLGWTAGAEWYYQQVESVEQQLTVDRYFLFSDDLDWCREHAKELGLSIIQDRLTFVEGNRGNLAYVDMQLMAMCHHRLSDRSSFSLLAGILCRWPDKLEFNRWWWY